MLSLPVPRGKEGREARFRAQTMGAGSLQYSLALYLIDTAATRRSRYPWSQKDPPSTGKGHCSAVRLKAEPESTNWFGGSEVTTARVWSWECQGHQVPTSCQCQIGIGRQ